MVIYYPNHKEETMTLNELRFIVAVAQERNFRRASERCFISQPALSLAIQKLEDELGVKIFERSKTEVSATPVGAAIVEQAQRVLEEAARIGTIAAAGSDQLAAPLRLGVIHSVGPYLLPDLIPALKKLAPGMALEVEENITANLDTLLRNRDLTRILLREAVGLDAGFDRKLDEFYRRLAGLIERSLVSGCEMGLVRDLDRRVASLMILGALKQVLDHSLTDPDSLPPVPALAREFLGIVRSTFLVDPAGVIRAANRAAAPMGVAVGARAPGVGSRPCWLRQRSRWMSGESVMSILACLAASTKACSGASGRPSMVPQMMLWNWLVCLMVPGGSITVAT
jgi:DNA-binding transcriptional LysR family regulator